jgi:hypothetical protein
VKIDFIAIREIYTPRKNPLYGAARVTRLSPCPKKSRFYNYIGFDTRGHFTHNNTRPHIHVHLQSRITPA